jgi:hypothetical protein
VHPGEHRQKEAEVVPIRDQGEHEPDDDHVAEPLQHSDRRQHQHARLAVIGLGFTSSPA